MEKAATRRRRTRLLLPLALVAVLATTVLLTIRDHQAAVAAHEGRTAAALSLAASRVESAVARGEVAVDGVAGLFAASDQVDASAFATYTVTASELGDLLPGVTALGWAVPVAAEDVESFERDVLNAVPAGLRAMDTTSVRPPFAEGEAIVVQYAHRLDDNPSDAQGFALSSSPERMAALRQAAATGITVSTQPLELVGGNTGLLLVRAVEDEGGEVEGYVVMPIEATPFLASVVADDRITVTLVDDESGEPVVDEGPGVTPSDVDLTDTPSTQVDVAGRIWTLTATSTSPPPTIFAPDALPGRLAPLLLVLAIFVLVERERRHKVRSLEMAAGIEREAAAREQELALSQRRLLSTVSHELRTPLTAIIGYGSLLGEQLPGGSTLHGFAKRIGSNAVVLKDLVDDLLAFSRLERGEFSLLPEEHDLAVLTADTLDSIEPILRGHPVKLDAVPAHAEVDQTAYRRVVTNLVENAARYGGPEAVDVHVLAEDGHAVLHVDDRGPGVAVEERDLVFERFERGSTGRAADSSGTGLGLAVVRGLAEAMGGTATVGEAPTGGARFTVRLPLVRHLPDDPPSSHEAQPQLQESR